MEITIFVLNGDKNQSPIFSEMNKHQLANRIWASANKMRSKIEANEYKDYILGFIFYKFLSEQEVKFLTDNGMEREGFVSLLTEDDNEMVKWVQSRIGFFIAHENLYSTWLEARGDIKVEKSCPNT